MPGFQKGEFRTPWGSSTFLRSTRDVKTDSRMIHGATIPEQTIDGHPGQKGVRKGLVLATITTHDDPLKVGMVGPFQAGGAGTDEVQTLTKTGTWSGGTYTLTVLGATTAPIPYNATAVDIQTAVRNAIVAADNGYEPNDIDITGGPLATTPVVVTFDGSNGGNLAPITYDVALVTGTTPGLGVVETTAGIGGATDGRADINNIVGICNTELPWQTTEGDREVACVYEAAVYQNRLYMLNAAGQEVPVDDATAAAMFGKKHLDIRFRG
jgi:hypothetical protein